MKRTIVFVCIAAAIAIPIAGLTLSKERIALRIAAQEIKKALLAESVTIGGCRVDPRRMIAFSDIAVRRPGFLEATIKSVVVHYSIPALFTGSISRIEIDGAHLSVDLKHGVPPDLGAAGALKKPGSFHVRDMVISGSRLSLIGRGLSLEATAAGRFSPYESRVSDVDIAIESFNAQGFTIKSARLVGQPGGNDGAALSAQTVALGDAAFSDVRGTLRIDGRRLTVEPVSGMLFNGSVSGSIGITLDTALEYSIVLACKGLDLATAVKTLKLDEKIGLTGLVNGDIMIIGAGLTIGDIRGSFSTDEPGGMVIIKDASMLENIATTSKQPMQMVMDNLKNYAYTIGVMKVSLNGSDLALDIALDGNAGKREFNVILHDSIGKKSGVS